MLSDEMKAWVAISAFQSNDKGELIVKFEDTSSSFREMISFITKVKKDQLTFSEPKQDYSQVRFADVDSFIKDVDVKECLKWRSHNIGYRARLKVMEVLTRIPNIVVEYADNYEPAEKEIPQMDQAALKAITAFAASIDSATNAEKKAIAVQKVGWIWTHYQANKETQKTE